MCAVSVCSLALGFIDALAEVLGVEAAFLADTKVQRQFIKKGEHI